MKKTPEVQEEEKGFEALLKPIQDVIAKDWKLRLKSYLEHYITYLHKLGFINFSEAAIIVQNTTGYYCKRVDLMYTWVRQFCMNLAKNCDDPITEDKTESNQTKKSKKKETSTEEEEEMLERFTYKHIAKFKAVCLSKIAAQDPKIALINTNARAACKGGIAVPVFATNNEDMGYKDEFRVYMTLAQNGQLFPDILPSEITIQWAQDDEDDFLELNVEDVGSPDDVYSGSHADPPMDIEGEPPIFESSRDYDLPLDPPGDISDHPDIGGTGVGVANEKLDETQAFVKVIPFSSLIIHKKFKKACVFTLPKELILEHEEHLMKKWKKSNKGKTSKESFHLSFSELLGGKSEDMISHRLRKRQSERLKLQQKNKKETEKKMKAPADMNIEQGDEDNDHVDDFDDNLGDLRDGERSAPCFSALDDAQDQSIEQAYEESCRIAQMNKRRDDVLSIQQRVADWHAMIEPALREAEKRSQYDVHEYGTRILEQFREIGEEIDLAQVIDADHYKDVCRYVLSSLMLANTYNLEIIKKELAELTKDNIQLKLLSLIRHHEELDANIGEATAGTY